MANRSINLLTKDFKESLLNFIQDWNYLPISNVALVLNEVNNYVQATYNNILNQEEEQYQIEIKNEEGEK